MLERLRRVVVDYFYPPPVTWDELMHVITLLESIDRDIKIAQYEQQLTSDVYRFASIESEVEGLMKQRAAVSRKKQSILSRAKRHGPVVEYDLYEKFV